MKSLYAVLLILVWTSPVAAQDCDDIVFSSQSRSEYLHDRAELVRACLDAVDETAAGIYRASFNLCERQAQVFETPRDFILPTDTKVISVDAKESWEELALRIGKNAGEAGCRDGILSALLQKDYFTTKRIRQLFSSRDLILDQPFNYKIWVEMDTIFGTIDGTLEVDRSTLLGRFNDVGSIRLQDQSIRLDEVPFELTGRVAGSMQAAGVLETYFDSPYTITGSLSGSFDQRSFETSFDIFRIDTIEVNSADLSFLNQNILEDLFQSEIIKQEMALFWSDLLRAEYNKIDPFSFISRSRLPE